MSYLSVIIQLTPPQEAALKAIRNGIIDTTNITHLLCSPYRGLFDEFLLSRILYTAATPSEIEAFLKANPGAQVIEALDEEGYEYEELGNAKWKRNNTALLAIMKDVPDAVDANGNPISWKRPALGEERHATFAGTQKRKVT